MQPSRGKLKDRHALLAPGLTNVFEMLRVSASLQDWGWYVIHYEPNVANFEIEHGRELKRDAYNMRCMAEARRTGKVVLGRHAGMLDCFVPIGEKESESPLLVTGPFAESYPTHSELSERWLELSGRQAHPADPEFHAYFTMSLDTLVLGAEGVPLFERWLTIVARLLAGEGDADALYAEAVPLRDRLERARFGDRMWEMARSMVDERTARSWSSPHRLDTFRDYGLSRLPDQVLVALAVTRHPETESVEELLKRHAFQRACAELGLGTKNLITGRVGDYGVTFLAPIGPGARRKQWAHDMAAKGTAIARRFDLDLHFGQSPLPPSLPLSEHFRAALSAAEGALSRGARFQTSPPPAERPGFVLGELRRNLAHLVLEKPRLLSTHFERYLEAVAQRSGYRLETMRVHLEAGFERVVESVQTSGALGEKALAELTSDLVESALDARTVVALCGAYRRAVAEIASAMQTPISTNRDRNLSRALTFIHRNYTTALSLERVAREAGFAPNYFSKLFKERERITFEKYLLRLRIQRAKVMLASRDLDAQRVGVLAGFTSPSYFGKVFKDAVGMTPLQYRRAQSD